MINDQGNRIKNIEDEIIILKEKINGLISVIDHFKNRVIIIEAKLEDKTQT